MKNQKIAIIGPYPKPYGGISVHIQRVLEQLDSRSIPYDFYNESKPYLDNLKGIRFSSILSRVSGLIRIANNKYKLIHYHSPNILGRIVFCFFGIFGKEIYIHVHGASLHESLSKPFLGKLLVFLLRFVYVIADNNLIYQLARKNNPKQVFLVDAFIPPVVNLFHPELNNFHQHVDESELLISMAGWFTEYNDHDLYGFDLTCKAIGLLKKKINVRVLISVNGIQSQLIYNKFIKMLIEMKLESNIILLTDDLKDLWPLIINTDLFIRPTISDGSSVSIKEALWLDVPVIASDCVERELGCVLYSCDCEKDLYQKLLTFSKRNYKERDVIKRVKSANLKSFKNKLFTDIYEI